MRRADSRAPSPFACLALGLCLAASSVPANSGPAGNGIDVTAVGSFSDQAEDANGRREDGCSLHFIVDNRSDLDLKSFQSSFEVLKQSSGAPLKKHFPLVLTKVAARSTRTSPPDLIHGVRCEDLKVLITRSTCRQDANVACPTLKYTAKGLAAVEVKTP